jgi:hypothetical protein
LISYQKMVDENIVKAARAFAKQAAAAVEAAMN